MSAEAVRDRLTHAAVRVAENDDVGALAVLALALRASFEAPAGARAWQIIAVQSTAHRKNCAGRRQFFGVPSLEL